MERPATAYVVNSVVCCVLGGVKHNLIDNLRVEVRLQRSRLPRKSVRAQSEHPKPDTRQSHQLPAHTRVPAQGPPKGQDAPQKRSSAPGVRTCAVGQSSREFRPRESARFHRRLFGSNGGTEGKWRGDDIRWYKENYTHTFNCVLYYVDRPYSRQGRLVRVIHASWSK